MGYHGSSLNPESRRIPMDENQSDGRDRRTAFAVVRAIKRWRLRDWLLVNLLLALALGFWYLRISSPPPAISTQTYEQIEMGMTWREVHDIVRAMPGGYGSVWNPHDEIHAISTEPAARFDEWWSADGILTIGYDADGRVCEKKIIQANYPEPSHPEHWSWWKRQMHRQIPGSQKQFFFSPF
jgi:hypothetical protein